MIWGIQLENLPMRVHLIAKGEAKREMGWGVRRQRLSLYI